MSSMSGFHGGPMDGQPINPDTVRQADQSGGLDLQGLMQQMAGGGPGGAPPGAPPPGGAPDPGAEGTPQDDANLSEADRITRVLSDLMILSGRDSSYSEQDKAQTQQAMSLLQKIKAAEEKMHNDALGGKIAPQLLQKQFLGAGG
jgi:hypothetical protein